MHARLDNDLNRWAAHDLISPDEAEAILAFESAASSPRSGFLAEALGYVGAALAIGAVLVLAGDVWSDLPVAGHLAALGFLSVALLAGGWMTSSKDDPPLQRLSDVLLSGTALAVALLTAQVASEIVGWNDERVTIAGAVLGAIVGGLLWLRRRHTLELIVAVGALFVVAVDTVSYVVPDPSAILVGSVIWVVGVAVFGAGHFGVLAPRTTALVLGSIGVLVGSQVLATDTSVIPALAAAASAGGLVLYAVHRRDTAVLALGGLGVLMLVPQLAFAVFGESLGAPAALFVAGILLIGIAVGVARAHAGDRRSGPEDSETPETAEKDP